MQHHRSPYAVPPPQHLHAAAQHPTHVTMMYELAQGLEQYSVRVFGTHGRRADNGLAGPTSRLDAPRNTLSAVCAVTATCPPHSGYKGIQVPVLADSSFNQGESVSRVLSISLEQVGGASRFLARHGARPPTSPLTASSAGPHTLTSARTETAAAAWAPSTASAAARAAWQGTHSHSPARHSRAGRARLFSFWGPAPVGPVVDVLSGRLAFTLHPFTARKRPRFIAGTHVGRVPGARRL